MSKTYELSKTELLDDKEKQEVEGKFKLEHDSISKVIPNCSVLIPPMPDYSSMLAPFFKGFREQILEAMKPCIPDCSAMLVPSINKFNEQISELIKPVVPDYATMLAPSFNKLNEQLSEAMKPCIPDYSGLVNGLKLNFLNLNEHLSEIMKPCIPDYFQIFSAYNLRLNEQISEMIKPCIPDYSQIFSEYNLKIVEQLSEVIKFSAPDFTSLTFSLNQISESLNNMQFRIPQVVFMLGKSGWCVFGNKHLEDSGLLDIYDINIDRDTSNNIDEIAMMCITKEIISKIIEDTLQNLNDNDQIKFNQAVTEYNSEEYYKCAFILNGLIDSVSIKKCADEDNKKEFGWNAFFYLCKKNLNKFFPNIVTIEKEKDINGKAKRREEMVDSLLIKTKTAYKDFFNLLSISNLILSISKIFDNYDFKNYKTNKPKIINRNWIAHGMYDIDDISKTDCTKLLLILYQLSELYKKIRNQTL